MNSSIYLHHPFFRYSNLMFWLLIIRCYAQLGGALLYAGDTFNAKIALGITTRLIEDARARTTIATEKFSSSNDFSEPVVVPAAAEVEVEADHQVGQAEQEDPTSAANQEVADTDVAESSSINSDTVAEDQAEAGSKETSVPNEEAIGTQKSIDQQSKLVGEEEVAEELNPKYAGFTSFWTCHGPCSTDPELYAELHFCRTCNDTYFCENCIVLVKSNTMPFRACAADYEHVQVYPMSEEARRVTTALVERRFEVQQQWLDMLKKEWQD
ncbi:MAG: hypothetical protein M1822_004088 [Bathelium mastoideum]|nr:MAG: hypothetical protein M1822_004088 [Bathelium mastoideum]